MSLEQRINYQLNKYPIVKRVIKRAYQRTMYAVSPKVKSEGNIIRISPDDKEHEYFFGYYDKSPWDITDRYVICLKANNTWADVSPREKADILLIDTEKLESDPERVRKIAETRAWNVQQACMLQWLGPDYNNRIIYNDYREGKYVSVILTISTMEERVIPAPVYSVSSDGKFALTLDFSRLYNLRPGYGYYNMPEKTKGIALPDTTAIWKIDLETGEVSDLLKYTDFAKFQPRQEMQEKKSIHKVNHIMLSPNGRRFMVLYRWFNGERKYTRLITCNIDGSDMYILSDDDMVSHCFWKDDEHIIAFENKKKSGTGYYLMKDKSQEYYHCWPEMTGDGHPSYSPDGSLVVTDTYPDKTRIASLKIMDGNEKKNHTEVVARVFAPFKYDNDTRCDLHPRWNHASNMICFDSVFEGHRGVYVVKIKKNERKNNWKRPLVSVIVPVYNVEKYLDRCVQSLINQTYCNLEIILVDDGSPDRCPQLCDAYAEKYCNVRVIHKLNGGLSSARNVGIDNANGDFISFVDSDDWVALDAYEYMVNTIIEYNADVADVGIVQVKDKNQKIKLEKEVKKCFSGKEILVNYLYRGLNEKNGAPYSVCRKLYKKVLFVDDTSHFTEGIVNEDICFNYRVLKKCHRVVISNQPKYFYFQGNESITTGKCKKRDLALLNVSSELVELAKESNDKEIVELAKMKRARSDFSILARIAVAGVDDSINDSQKLIKTLAVRLRKNLFLIWKSPMPINRKIISTIIGLNYKLFSKCIKLSKRKTYN